MIEHISTRTDRPLSAAVRAGDWLYISGQASTDPKTGEFVPGTFEEEFERSVVNLYLVLAEAGADASSIVRVTGYVRDEESLPLYNRLYLKAFAHPRPARTTIAMGFDFLKFEINAIAYLGA